MGRVISHRFGCSEHSATWRSCLLPAGCSRPFLRPRSPFLLRAPPAQGRALPAHRPDPLSIPSTATGSPPSLPCDPRADTFHLTELESKGSVKAQIKRFLCRCSAEQRDPQATAAVLDTTLPVPRASPGVTARDSQERLRRDLTHGQICIYCFPY